jgi:hypothetical protein
MTSKQVHILQQLKALVSLVSNDFQKLPSCLHEKTTAKKKINSITKVHKESL